MKEIISFFAQDIKGEGFTRQELAVYSLLPAAIAFAAVLAGGLLS